MIKIIHEVSHKFLIFFLLRLIEVYVILLDSTWVQIWLPRLHFD
jgi:hypothetical protein